MFGVRKTASGRRAIFPYIMPFFMPKRKKINDKFVGMKKVS